MNIKQVSLFLYVEQTLQPLDLIPYFHLHTPRILIRIPHGLLTYHVHEFKSSNNFHKWPHAWKVLVTIYLSLFCSKSEKLWILKMMVPLFWSKNSIGISVQDATFHLALLDWFTNIDILIIMCHYSTLLCASCLIRLLKSN